MVTRKKAGQSDAGAGSILSTVSGPSDAAPPTTLGSKDPVAEQLLTKTVSGQALSAAIPHNPNKAAEYGGADRYPAVRPCAGRLRQRQYPKDKGEARH